MAADWELEHWQAKSVAAQPTLEAAEVMQGIAHVGTLAATLTQAAWAATWLARPRKETAMSAYFMVMGLGERIGVDWICLKLIESDQNLKCSFIAVEFYD